MVPPDRLQRAPPRSSLTVQRARSARCSYSPRAARQSRRWRVYSVPGNLIGLHSPRTCASSLVAP
eukprot:15025701-Alexandrium_andersonii.AAC.1